MGQTPFFTLPLPTLCPLEYQTQQFLSLRQTNTVVGFGLMELLKFFMLLLFIFSAVSIADGGGFIGVNYGRMANNLPSSPHVVQLLKSKGLNRVKIYDADSHTLRALSGSGIQVTVDLPNEVLSFAANTSFAESWVQNNVVAYPNTTVEAIAVGNEVFADTHNPTRFLIPAMYNIQKALEKYDLQNVKISSPIALSALQNSYPPSAGSFRHDLIEPVLKPMLEFLNKTGSPLMVNAYPFFAYKSNADVIPLNYSLLRDNPGVVDAGNGLRYFSLFDAQIDAVFAAMSALNYENIRITVSETGWPSKGDATEIGASVTNAAAYNGNLVRRVLTGGGTPLRPHADLTVYLFALFNENSKVGPTSERNFGLFNSDETTVYNIPFTADGFKKYKDDSPAQAPATVGGEQGVRTWCVAKNDVGKDQLLTALNFACGEGQADCSLIQPGSSCFNPNTMKAHASYAFNSYYKKNGLAHGSCHFGGVAEVVSEQPVFGNCDFP